MEQALRSAYLAGQAPRREDTQKVDELLPVLEEVQRAIPRRPTPFTLVDACAGKGALGVLAASLLLASRNIPWRVVALEREGARRARLLDAAKTLDVAAGIQFVETDVGDVSAWPKAPDVVVALHACGRATDVVIDAATTVGAKRLCVVPCCYAGGPRHAGAVDEVPGQAAADAWARTLPLPRHGLVGRRVAAALIDAERTLRLEARGYETEVVEAFPPTISPHNLLWRARRVREPVRMAEAAARHRALVEVERDMPRA